MLRSCVRDFDREIECEIEWRTRLSALDVHNVMHVFFRNVDNVFVEEYRLTRHCNMQRRLGTRTLYDSFEYDDVKQLLDLCGIPIKLSQSTTTAAFNGSTTKIATTDAMARDNNLHVNTFSQIKMTNCSHTFYYYDTNVDHRNNNLWPRIFQCKRSIEITDDQNDEVNDASDDVEKEFAAPSRLSLEKLDEALRDSQLSEKLSRLQTCELDKSDNNLGVQYIRKMYRYFSHRNFDKVRLALYFLFDEYQQISYELSLEYEFTNGYDVIVRSLASTTPHLERVDFLRTEFPFQDLLDTLSYFVSHVSRLCLSFVERPMIKLGMDWTDQVTSASSVSLRSYTIEFAHASREVNFVRHVYNVLSKSFSRDMFVKRKLDGVKCHATFDGGNFLCVDDGTRIDLRKLVPSRKRRVDFRDLFSTDLIYQLERIGGDRYVITEVSTVRNNYMKVLSSLVQSYAPSRNCYKYSQEQRWPYGLFGVPLNESILAKMLYFKTLSCSSSSSGERASDERFLQIFLETIAKKCDTEYENENLIDEISKGDEVLYEEDVATMSSKVQRNIVSECNDADDKAEDEDECNVTVISEKNEADVNSDIEDFDEIHEADDEIYDDNDDADDDVCSIRTADTIVSSSGNSCDDKVSTNMSKIRRGCGSGVVRRDIGCTDIGGNSSVNGVVGDISGNDGVSSKSIGGSRSTSNRNTGSRPTVESNVDATLSGTEILHNQDCRFYVSVSSKQSSNYLDRLSSCFHTLGITSDANLSINGASAIDDTLLSFSTDLRYYYRIYVYKNILKILHDNELSDLCKNRAYTFFDSDTACRILDHLEHDHECIDCSLNIVPPASRSSTALPMDGFLFYKFVDKVHGSRNTSGQFQTWNLTTVNRNKCAFYDAVAPFFRTTIVLKLKPFQTIELMLQIEQSPDDMFALNFHSSRINDTPFLACDDIPRNLKSVPLFMFLSRCVWRRYDGTEVRVYVDKMFERSDSLVSSRVYEFLCYDENEFYLLKERNDKILPDDDRKISNIVWRRTDFSTFFV